jgi:glycine/D-amino acid oxidase-like deaminating enzyme
MNDRKWKVCVIGGGVIGLASAHFIRNLTVGNKPVDVTIISDQFSPDVTSSVAAGFWEPYMVGTPDQLALVK